MSQGNAGGQVSVTTRLYTKHKTGSAVYLSSYPRIISDNTQNWQGSMLPHFYKRRKAGELLPFGSWYKFEALVLTNSGNWSSRYVSGSTVDDYSYYDNGHPGIMPLLTAADLQQMLGDFDAKPYVQAAAAKIASSGFDLLTFVAELHQVHALWRDAGKTLARLLKQSKGSVANSWLQYRYGWRMLYYDFLNIQKLITSLDNKRVRLKERAGREITRTSVAHFVSPRAYGTVYWSTEDRLTCGVRGLVCADIDVPPIQINPFVTAWELCKYSFVIDWFFQVGQWISTMSFLSAESAHFACESYALTCERTLSIDSIIYSPGWSNPEANLHQQHKCRLLVRTPASIPLGIQTTLKLDAFKVTDLTAIVLQLLRR